MSFPVKRSEKCPRYLQIRVKSQSMIFHMILDQTYTSFVLYYFFGSIANNMRGLGVSKFWQKKQYFKTYARNCLFGLISNATFPFEETTCRSHVAFVSHWYDSLKWLILTIWNHFESDLIIEDFFSKYFRIRIIDCRKSSLWCSMYHVPTAL